jgi:hypothetical protein
MKLNAMSRNDRERRYLGRVNGQHKRTRYDARTIDWKAKSKRRLARGEDLVF